MAGGPAAFRSPRFLARQLQSARTPPGKPIERRDEGAVRSRRHCSPAAPQTGPGTRVRPLSGTSKMVICPGDNFFSSTAAAGPRRFRLAPWSARRRARDIVPPRSPRRPTLKACVDSQFHVSPWASMDWAGHLLGPLAGAPEMGLCPGQTRCPDSRGRAVLVAGTPPRCQEPRQRKALRQTPRELRVKAWSMANQVSPGASGIGPYFRFGHLPVRSWQPLTQARICSTLEVR